MDHLALNQVTLKNVLLIHVCKGRMWFVIELRGTRFALFRAVTIIVVCEGNSLLG